MPHYFVSFETEVDDSGGGPWIIPPSACWVTARNEAEATHRARVKLSRPHGGGHLGAVTTLVEIGPEEFEAYQRRYREALDAAGIDWRGVN